jgi:hypothetical protein
VFYFGCTDYAAYGFGGKRKQLCVLSEIMSKTIWIAVCCKHNITNDDSKSLPGDNAPIKLVEAEYCHVVWRDYRRGLDSWLDLLTTYTHDS